MLLEARAGAEPIVTSAPAGVSRDVAPLAFLAAAKARGMEGALVTISGIDGGAPRPPGTYMAVLADGSHAGHVSGGCVEPAIAAEVKPLIGTGKDEVIRFGKGSCFIDIRFPCGGGVDLLVHTSPSAEMLQAALALDARRQAFGIAFEPAASHARVIESEGTATGWQDGVFARRHLPRTRLLAVGRGPDLEVLARVAAAAELELRLATPDESTARALSALDVPVELLRSPRQPWDLPIDPWTATVLMFHEHEWENAILARAAAADGFYVGALGSVRTPSQRRERLLAMGVPAKRIDRIRGPIGLIDRARDPGTLALSVLAEIAAARNALDRA
jgi:xanthine dehydrogenase accessory factor